MLLTVKVVAEESGVVEVVVTLVLVGDVDEVEFVVLLEVRDEEVVMAVEATPLVPVATGWLGSIAKEKWNNRAPRALPLLRWGRQQERREAPCHYSRSIWKTCAVPSRRRL